MNSWDDPVSSNYEHFIVTILTYVVFVPPNPLITLWQSFSGPTKSSTLCDIQPDHLLYNPMMNELISNLRSHYDPLSYVLYDIASLTYIYFNI